MKLRILTIFLLCIALLASCGSEADPVGTSDADATVISETETESGAEITTDTETETEAGTETETTVMIETEAITESETEIVTEIVTETVPATETETEAESKPPVTEPTTSYWYWRHQKVLMYHLIKDVPYSYNVGLFVRPRDFEEHIRCLLEAGYTFYFADEYRRTENRSVILTFDDGYADNYTELFPILKKYNIKATIFLIGDYVDRDPRYLTAEQIKEMSESGLVQFGCHTMSHRDLSTLDDDAVRTELEECIDFVKGLSGQDCTTVAYPYGGYNDAVTAIAKEYFRFAYTSEGKRGTDRAYGYHIGRYYVARGMDGAELLAMISD